MQEFGIQKEWTITTTRTPWMTRSTRSTRSTTRNPTMCAATSNTWRTRERVRSCSSLRSQSLFLLLSRPSLAHQSSLTFSSLQIYYFCHLSRTSLVHHEMHTVLTEMHLHQADDRQIETAPLAHVACAPWDSGVLLTDFAAAYPNVNHSWIFSVLENTGLPDFLCRFLRSIYSDSITHVEFAGAERGQFFMARGARHGCFSSDSFFAMAFDPIFRWFEPVQCGYTPTISPLHHFFEDFWLHWHQHFVL